MRNLECLAGIKKEKAAFQRLVKEYGGDLSTQKFVKLRMTALLGHDVVGGK
jgi:hypothetical protein